MNIDLFVDGKEVMPNESVGTAAIELKHVANGEKQEIEFID